MAAAEILNPPFLGDLIRTQAKLRPTEIAFSFEGRDTTYKELDDLSDQVASAFVAAGLKPGDRVAWLAQNLDSFWQALFAAAKSGIVLTPLNWRLAPAEIAAILNDSTAKLFFAETQFLEPLAKRPDFDPPETILLDAGAANGFEHFRGSAAAATVSFEPKPEDAVVQLYTSGTTGLPKGVILSHRCFYEVGVAGIEANILRPADGEIVVHALPHFHIAGVCFGLMGFTRSMPVSQYRQFDPAAIVKDAQSGPNLHGFLVPAMVLMLLETAKASGASLDRFSSISYGAAPMPEPLLNAAIGAFSNAEFIQLYGMTETTGGVTALAPDDHAASKKQRVSAGKPLPGCEVKVCEPGGGPELPCGEVGEVVVKSSFVMEEYWNRKDATDEVLKDGWYYSGDAGHFDENGYLYVVDRIKDMIISGGENIYPAEIESALAAHPNIREAAVIGVPNERWGESVKAVIATRDGAEISQDDLSEFLADRIARFKIPQSVAVVDALPRNASGKILKTELRGN